MKRLVLIGFMLVLGLTAVACGGVTTTAVTTAAATTTAATTAATTTQAGTTAATTTAATTATTTTAATTAATTTTEAPITVQGVTATTILIGNTAATTGYFAGVGVPFNAGIEAVLKLVNDAGGIDGRTINFIHYDDTFVASTGLTYTQRLVEEDEVFALVGHFGTPTVGATLEYIQEVGVPMVYAATGINALYFAESVGNPVMAVQPIYMTDGRIMAARAVQEEIYGETKDQPLAAGEKVGVIYTNDDVGLSIKAGIEIEAEILGRTADFSYQSVSTYTFNTAVTMLKAAGVKTVILAMNQEPFGYALTAMSNLALNVPVFSSYVNADITVVDQFRYNVNRPIYVNAWLDIFDPEGLYGFAQSYWDFVAVMTAAGYDGNTEGKANYTANSFAMAGYIAASVFVEGLKRVETNAEDLTWATYIAAMEESAIDIPMGGVVDFSGGKRWGIASMALMQYGITLGDNPATLDVTETDYILAEAFTKVRPIQTIEEIEGN